MCDVTIRKKWKRNNNFVFERPQSTDVGADFPVKMETIKKFTKIEENCNTVFPHYLRGRSSRNV